MTINRIYILIRQSAQNPLFAIVQILGLSIGFFILILIGMYANHEFSYDRYHTQYKRIYRLIQISNYNGIVENSSSAPFPVKKAIDAEYPEIIEASARIFNYQNTFQLVSSPQSTQYEPGLFFVDSDLLKVLDIHIKKRQTDSLLVKPYKALITESAAQRFFKNSDAVGKTLIINNNYPVEVEAVVADPPSQTHFRFTILVSMETVRQNYSGKLPDSWAWNPCWTYVKLKKGVDRSTFEKVLDEFSRRHLPSNRENSSYFKAQPISDIHLSSKLDYEISSNGNIVNLLTICALGLFIFILAIINYIILTTAQTFHRLKEIVVRKVVGMSNSTLLAESIFESFVISAFSLLISLIFIELFLDDFNQFVGTDLKFSNILLPENLLLIAIAILLASILGGLYPSINYSRLNIAEVLKGKFPRRMLLSNFRKFLVVIQVAIALGLLVVSQVIFRQYRFLVN
ncbi:MAG TPA: ABC transporter permease, partial [Salinivirgaceae bacterium]|nr:ABC transporter permease [Salinivirgaceae bacterium]